MAPQERLIPWSTKRNAVATRMLEHGIRNLPVVDGHRLLGMVSARDLLMLEAWPTTG